jgi:ABC-type Na+ efflux pump permease subunit
MVKRRYSSGRKKKLSEFVVNEAMEEVFHRRIVGSSKIKLEREDGEERKRPYTLKRSDLSNKEFNDFMGVFDKKLSLSQNEIITEKVKGSQSVNKVRRMRLDEDSKIQTTHLNEELKSMDNTTHIESYPINVSEIETETPKRKNLNDVFGQEEFKAMQKSTKEDKKSSKPLPRRSLRIKELELKRPNDRSKSKKPGPVKKSSKFG